MDKIEATILGKKEFYLEFIINDVQKLKVITLKISKLKANFKEFPNCG